MAKQATNTTKSRELEPRGRPSADRPSFSGASPDDPLVSIQIVKVRASVWQELAVAAAEKKWHRSVLVREILDEWVRRRQAKKSGKKAA